MPTYEELVQDIGAELGGKIPPNLPFLIRSVERELWQHLWFLGRQRLVSFALPAGSSGLQSFSGLTSVSPDFVLMIEGVFLQSTGETLTRVSLHRFLREAKTNRTGDPEIYTVDLSTDQIGFYPVPSSGASQLEMLVRIRDDYIQAGDNENTKLLLGVGYEVLKWAVLSKRIFDPNKAQYWRQQYAEALSALLTKLSRERWSYRGGTQYHDSPTSFE